MRPIASLASDVAETAPPCGSAAKNNAFNAEMIRELILALDKVASDASLRFLLLRGRGKHFSAGADLAWMQQSAELDYHTSTTPANWRS
jgi:methylglutaconyl-CoA hydratase